MSTQQQAEQKVQDFETWDDVVLYDVFAEAATRLGGWLVNEQDKAEDAGDADLAAAWEAERFAVRDEKKAVGPRNREGQAAAILRWNARREEIDAGSGPRATAR